MTTTIVYGNSQGSHGDYSHIGFGTWGAGMVQLYVGNVTDPYGNYGYYVGHIDFPLSGAIPAGAVVNSASLTVPSDVGGFGTGTPGTFSVYTTTVLITTGIYGVAPSASQAVGSLSGPVTTHPFTWSGALTASIIQAACGGNGVNGLLIYGSGPVSGQNNIVHFDGGGANAAIRYVTINHSFPPGTPGAFVTPITGQTYAGAFTIVHGASTDTDTVQGSLQYQIDYSSNGGGSWTTLVDLSAAGVTSYLWDTSLIPSGVNFKLRVRSWDGSNWSLAYQTSGTFAIGHFERFGGIPI